jgi:predicted unusual protein kinase regulating ubiquinone biosynthesis (AarF/ABC1/UbiB family)
LLISNSRRTGQTKSLSKEERILFSKLVIALDDDDKEEIVRLMTVAGFRSRRMDPGMYYTAIESVFFISLPIFA